MIGQDNIDDLAAEYVLGTLDTAERVAVAARRLREPALEAAIQAWDRLLSPLNDLVRPAAPPPGLFPKIEARLQGRRPGAENAGNVVDMTRRMKRWRMSAIAASALAASLALVIGVREFGPKTPSKNLVAVLQKDAASPAFLVSVDIDNKLMTVRPVAAKREKGKSYELWIVQDSLGAPKSLGVIDDDNPMRRATLAAYKPDVIESATLAVSLEPEGGSPTGAPTGPVVFTGKLIESTN